MAWASAASRGGCCAVDGGAPAATRGATAVARDANAPAKQRSLAGDVDKRAVRSRSYLTVADLVIATSVGLGSLT